MKKLKEFYLRISRIRALKYIIVSVIAVVLIGFVDENSIWHHMVNQQYISELQEEIDRYTELHRHNKSQIDMLNKDPQAIRKIARERYFMKADDEDIFVLSDDNQDFTLGHADEISE